MEKQVEPRNWDALKKLESEATPAPWVEVVSKDVFSEVVSPHCATICMDVEFPPNAALIVAMRNALPALLSDLSRKEEEIQKLRNALSLIVNSRR